MEHGVILSKEQIKELTKDIKRLKKDGRHKEKFRQVFFDGEYIPYLISSYGRVVSLNYRTSDKVAIMNTKQCKTGYISASLFIRKKKRDVLVHRMVATAFISNPENKPEVNHINGKKNKNYVWNLEWVTSKENIRHAYKTNLKSAKCGEDIADSIYKEKDIRKVCKHLEENKLSKHEISKKTGVSVGMIKHIAKGHSWKHISKEYNISNYNDGKPSNYQKEQRQKIIDICKKLSTGNYTLQELADEYGYSYSLIYMIATRRRYRDISEKYAVENYKKLNKV